MYNRRRARALLAMLVISALVLVTVDFRSDGTEGEGPLGALRGLASTVLGPIQEGLSTLVSPIGDGVSSFTGLFDARAENQQLRAQLESLEERNLSYEDVLRENAELRDLLDMRERNDFTTVAAQVIASGPSNFEWTITLSVGSDAGVRRDMPVVSGDGLVGRVIQTTADTSRVLLAIDPNFRAATLHGASGEAGTLQGDGGSPMIFRPLDPEIELDVGDEIVTSSYSNGVFPAGIPIGTVSSADRNAGLLTRVVEVRPFVDFTRLNTVLVVIHAPERELPGLEIDPNEPFTPPDVDPNAPQLPDAPSETPSDGASPDGATPSDEPTTSAAGDG